MRVFLAELLVRTGDLVAATVEADLVRALVADLSPADIAVTQQLELLAQLELS